MPIKRSSAQAGQTLEEFYSDLTKEGNKITTIDTGKSMLLFIDMINKIFRETMIWGLTSHYRLVIQAKEQWNSDWYVIVYCIGTHEYYFEYLMPLEKRPWPYATVNGTAQSLNEAKNYLLIAMVESEGWMNNSELKNLVAGNL